MKVQIVGAKTGATTRIFIDGHPITRVRSIEYTVQAGGLAIVKLEIYPEVLEIELEDPELIRHEIGKISPMK